MGASDHLLTDRGRVQSSALRSGSVSAPARSTLSRAGAGSSDRSDSRAESVLRLAVWRSAVPSRARQRRRSTSRAPKCDPASQNPGFAASGALHRRRPRARAGHAPCVGLATCEPARASRRSGNSTTKPLATRRSAHCCEAVIGWRGDVSGRRKRQCHHRGERAVAVGPVERSVQRHASAGRSTCAGAA